MDVRIQEIINDILDDKIRKIIILSGSGISTITGIPDFRSQGGLYNTLRPELLTATDKEKNILKKDPTYVVHYDMFKNNPLPYLEIRRPFILGTYEKKWKPSIAHVFQKILEDKKLLKRVYTQNIDGLDLQTGLSKNNIINVHGNMSEICCEFCKDKYQHEKFIKHVKNNIRNIYDPSDKTQSKHLLCECCGLAGIKPNTVMYGRQIDTEIFDKVDTDFFSCDLLIITGTSLTVNPACTFINQLKPNTRRLVINNQYIGEDLGMNYSHKSNDSILLGDIDNGFLTLIDKLGWINDLLQYKYLMCENSKILIDEYLHNNSRI